MCTFLHHIGVRKVGKLARGSQILGFKLNKGHIYDTKIEIRNSKYILLERTSFPVQHSFKFFRISLFSKYLRLV